MNPEATLLYYEKPSPCDERLTALAELLGAPCKTLAASALHSEFDRAPDHQSCILASASTISHWCRDSESQIPPLDLLRQKSRFLFVYGFSPENDAISIAAGLTNGQISDVRRFERADSNYEVSPSHPQLTRDFSGLSFGPIQQQFDFGFACSSIPANCHPLISIAGLPLWVLSERRGCTVFLMACNEIADVREKIDDDLDISKYFSRLLPAAMFLKWAFKGQCWHSEHRFANFIIDDPLLKQSYGHLNYEELLLEMDENNFATTIAFIPWNHRRTEKKTAQLFRDRSDRLSLCIHGCDHTGAEFGITDVAGLNRRVRLASSRMNAHRVRTGLQHVPVMVFPQGGFSPEALRVLKCNNYLAAVNSCAAPSSFAKHYDLSIQDFLEPAITPFGGVPLYLRRYPGRVERFAFDLFFDKPLLVVEHHAYLKDRGRRLIDFIARLNSFGQLEWNGLGAILERTYLQCDVSAQTTACKLYSNSQVIENKSDRNRVFLITTSLADDVPVSNILVNGRTADFAISGHSLQLSMEIPARALAHVNILYRNVLPCAQLQHGFISATRTWTRRVLSEFRDNVLWKSDFLMATAQAVNHRFLSERLKSLSNTSTTGEDLR